MEIKTRPELVKLLPKNPVTAEIGVAEGLFSEDIMNTWKPSVHYMVDIWESRGEFAGDAGFKQDWHNKNYDRVRKMSENHKCARILRGSSVAMASRIDDGSLDFFHLDACHSFECVLADLKAWVPKLKVGGIASGHDFLNPDYGVKEAVYKFCNESGYEVKTVPDKRMEDACFYFIKTKR